MFLWWKRALPVNIFLEESDVYWAKRQMRNDDEMC